jgi:hypothetical protein
MARKSVGPGSDRKRKEGERMERRVQVDRPERFQTRISCSTVEAFFLHQELARWFPVRSKRDMLLDLEEDDMIDGISWLIYETDAPLSLQQRQFLISCGLLIATVELI